MAAVISKQTVRDAIEAKVIVPDGHTIFPPQHYQPFFSDSLLKQWRLISDHRSDRSSGKSTIFDPSGFIIDEICGVYNLTFLRVLCKKIGLELDYYPMGRGSEAQKWFAELEAWVKD